MPAIVSSTIVFPAPVGPRSMKYSPVCTVKLIPFREKFPSVIPTDSTVSVIVASF